MRDRIYLVAAVLVGLILVPAVALAGRSAPTIFVGDTSGFASTSGMSSHFTASGCGFRANDANDYLVVRGPGLYTSGLTTWTDHFPVSASGCGSATPSWSGSGVAGWFDVYVVHSPSGNPGQTQPLSNVVSVYIANP